MRSIAYLLELVRDNLDTYSKPPYFNDTDLFSICTTISCLKRDHIINKKERDKLNRYIFSHLGGEGGTGFWWSPSKKSPRVRYLNKHIKLNS